MLTVTLAPETERRSTECAQTRGISEAELVREPVEARLDDLDDIQMAVERPGRPLTSTEAHNALGPDDWIRSTRD